MGASAEAKVDEAWCQADQSPPLPGFASWITCRDVRNGGHCSGSNGQSSCPTTCHAEVGCQALCQADVSTRRRSGHDCTHLVHTTLPGEQQKLCSYAPTSRRRDYGGEVADTCQTTARSCLGC